MFALIVVLSLVTGGLSSILCPTKVDSQVTVHLPHPTSCSKFLTCVGNHPVEQDCPAGLHWNVEQSFCDYPRASACSRGQLEPRPFNSTAVANSVCLPQTSKCPLNSNPSERVIFLKHRDCRKFYACVSTQQVELSCPPNLYWNSQSCVCDYEVDAECEQTDMTTNDDEVPEEADGEHSEPEVVEDQQPAEEVEESVDDVEQEPAAPEDAEDQEPVEESADDVAEEPVEPEGVEDQEPAEESDSSVDEQPQESDTIVRVRRAADGDSSSSGSSGSSSGSDTSGSGSSSSGSSGSSGTGSSSSGSGSSGSTAQSGADIRAVSSIAVIAFTAAMSVL